MPMQNRKLLGRRCASKPHELGLSGKHFSFVFGRWLVWILAGTSAIFIEVFYSYLQYFQTNAKIVPQIRSCLFPSMPILINYLFYSAIWCCVMWAADGIIKQNVKIYSAEESVPESVLLFLREWFWCSDLTCIPSTSCLSLSACKSVPCGT